jgi:hypothetical protein
MMVSVDRVLIKLPRWTRAESARFFPISGVTGSASAVSFFLLPKGGARRQTVGAAR